MPSDREFVQGGVVPGPTSAIVVGPIHRRQPQSTAEPVSIDAVAAVLAELRELLPNVTQGEWFWNTYAGIESAALQQASNDQQWPEGMTKAEEAAFYRTQVYGQTETRVATVPPLAGDTAIGRHAYDARWIETLDPPTVTMLIDEIERLRLRTAEDRAVLDAADEWLEGMDHHEATGLARWEVGLRRAVRDRQMSVPTYSEIKAPSGTVVGISVTVPEGWLDGPADGGTDPADPPRETS